MEVRILDDLAKQNPLDQCTPDTTYCHGDTLACFSQFRRKHQRVFQVLAVSLAFQNGFPRERNRSYRLTAVFCGDTCRLFRRRASFQHGTVDCPLSLAASTVFL